MLIQGWKIAPGGYRKLGGKCCCPYDALMFTKGVSYSDTLYLDGFVAGFDGRLVSNSVFPGYELGKKLRKKYVDK